MEPSKEGAPPISPEENKIELRVEKATTQVVDVGIHLPAEAPTKRLTFSEQWTRTINSFMKPIRRALIVLTRHAANHPKSYVTAIIVVSIGLMLVGLATNFEVIADGDVWTPQDTRSVQHGDWIDSDDSGFPKDPRMLMLIVHRNGLNIVGDDLAQEGLTRVFQVLDTLRTTPDYHELCAHRDYVHPVTGEVTCDIAGVSALWNDNTTLFHETVTSNEDAIEFLSTKTLPSGRSVNYDQFIGYNECREEGNGGKLVHCTDGGTLTSGLSYITIVGLPGEDQVEDQAMDFEENLINNLKEMRDQWATTEDNDFQLEFLAYRSFDDEMMRSLSADFPLLPVVFVLMSVLCCLIFTRRDPVFSRAWLGFGAVVTVLMAITASFGLLFCIGVPFTNLTPILPFIMFGVGLDNAFIISGAFTRTDHMKPTVNRIEETIIDVGGTIMLTTLTAAAAFALGILSSIPAVRYLVMYAFPTILIGWLYQVTFFISLIVIDEQRIKDNRRDCCFCCSDQSPGSQRLHLERDRNPGKHFADRAMAAYTNVLLRPKVKIAVLVAFAGLFGVMTWSTTQLKQYFDFTEILPKDSYILGWWDALKDLGENNGVTAGIYFRDVDFSLNTTRQEMYGFVQELVDMPYAGRYPTYNFWLLDFDQYVAETNISGLPFNDQLAQFLSVGKYKAYDQHVVLDPATGDMLASRTSLAFDNHDYSDVKETVDALEMQEEISANQTVNQGRKDWAFFTWAEDYYIWEFYRVSPKELILTTLLGTASVSFLALLFIPHWSAAPLVFSMLVVLYIDLMGFIQLCGVSVGPVMYISMVMSIGLMVDYVMHVTYRYMEIDAIDRQEKTKQAMETIGASVMVGGLTTWLGVLPLGWSSSEIFFTVFVVFFGLVLFGLLHGLVLLPVILSLIGPQVVIQDSRHHFSAPVASSSRIALPEDTHNSEEKSGSFDLLHVVTEVEV
ncbi:Pick C1-like protein 1 [Seminavis robusta]|uniref:Pick C1-like protein 1 n=1 Tax=Seminavis robusta TaxID=568900 RepID=A0A9N8HYU2_9STRA|nr:Pick C1-like protein 1 [Seminavis robusta]|eukprot:Sro3014_g342110.1 Pick C1-like protein 1 (953) ;mRNA; f:1779-5286